MSARRQKRVGKPDHAVSGKAPVRMLPDDIGADIDARLAGLQQAYEAADGVERERHLLGALVQWDTLHPMPTWLYDALLDRQKARIHQRQPSMPWRDWWMVTGAHEEARRKGRPISLREAARQVSQVVYRKDPDNREKWGGKVWKNYKKVVAEIRRMKLGAK